MSDSVFFVPKIKCDGCAATIKEAISPLVERVEVDVEAKQVRVSLLPGEDGAERIRTALAEAGYPANP